VRRRSRHDDADWPSPGNPSWPGEPLYRTYADAISLVIEGIREIGKARAEEKAGEVVSEERFKELNNRLGAVRELFVTQAVARVGSDLDQ
jgi:hypothetical protein